MFTGVGQRATDNGRRSLLICFFVNCAPKKIHNCKKRLAKNPIKPPRLFACGTKKPRKNTPIIGPDNTPNNDNAAFRIDPR